MSGLYGEGGLRLLSAPAPVRLGLYIEGSGGMARLSPRVDIAFERFEVLEPVINGALNRIHWTEPLVGAGGGVIVQPGPLSIHFSGTGTSGYSRRVRST